MRLCGKNIPDTLGYRLVSHFFVLAPFDVISDLLLNRRRATWNLFVILSTLTSTECDCAALLAML